MELARTMRNEGWNLVATGITHQEDGINGLGWVSEQEKRRLLEESAILLVPSAFEGQPMVILEGLAAGCRVLTSDNLSGFEECVEKLPMLQHYWKNQIEQQSPNTRRNLESIKLHDIKSIHKKIIRLYSSYVADFD